MKGNKLWGEVDLKLVCLGVVVYKIILLSCSSAVELKWLIVVQKHLLWQDVIGNKASYRGLGVCVGTGKYCVCLFILSLHCMSVA